MGPRPSVIHGTAAEVQARAGALKSVSNQIGTASGDTKWTSPAGARFHSLSAGIAGDLVGVNGVLLTHEQRLLGWATDVDRGETAHEGRAAAIQAMMGGTAAAPDVPGAR